MHKWRQSYFDRARQDRPVPLYPKVRLAPQVARSLERAAAGALPLAIDPVMIAIAVTDPQARLRPGAVDADNRTLAAVGARLIQMVLGLELDAGRLPDHRAGVTAVSALATMLKLDSLREAASIHIAPTGRQETEGVQALVAAMFLRHGFEKLRDWLGPRLAESAQPRGAKMPTHQSLQIWLQDNCAAFVPGAVYTSALQNLQHILRAEEPAFSEVKSGPGHAPIFTVQASWQGLQGRGAGPNKKAARQKAAFEILQKAVAEEISWPETS